jgi:arginine utilization protein RocB
LDLSELDKYKGKWLFVYDQDIDTLRSNNVTWDMSYVVPHYRITMLKLPFLNPETRNKALTKAYLLHLN